MQRFTTQLALSAFVALAAAGTPCLANETPAAQPVASSSALSDVKVVRDENTKQLRAPTAEESAALDAKAKKLAPSVVEIQRPVSTVERRADGSMVGKRSLADMDNLVLETSVDGTKLVRHSRDGAAKTPVATTALPTE
ncbi:MAG: hypothetical protein WBM03_04040 [Steroidobacteraceae bacterium]|jgi:membrane-bound lytic murein transglycosylase B